MNIYRLLGEGALLFHIIPIMPLWYEMSEPHGPLYSLTRSLTLGEVLISFPYLVCLIISHKLYKLVHTDAPYSACTSSLLMSALTAWLYFTARGDAGYVTIFYFYLISIMHLG